MLYCFGDYELDDERHELRRVGQALRLEAKVYQVLLYFLQHPDQVVTKSELLTNCWPETFVSEAALTQCLSRLRHVIQPDRSEPPILKTLHRQGYRFLAEVTTREAVVGAPSVSGADFPLVEAKPLGAELIVAREAELKQLDHMFAQALAGTRQVVFISGEPGIGKTALLDAFIRRIEANDTCWIGWGQCIEQYGTSEAYLPLLDALGQLCRTPDHPQIIPILRQQAPSWILQMPGLLSADEYEALARRSNGVTRERMLRELTEAIEVMAAKRPVVLVLEDLHWSDYATLDWLAFVARRRAPARLLVLSTHRPADAHAHSHPVRTVMQELQRQGLCLELPLGYLSMQGVASYLTSRFGQMQFDNGVVELLQQRTNGNPFFLVTVIAELVRQNAFVDAPESEDLRQKLAFGVPESIQHLIEQQLSNVSPENANLLEVASVVGAEFSAAALAAGYDNAVETVESRCEALVRQGQFLRFVRADDWPDGTIAARYGFIHDLYRETLYQRVPVARRGRLHQQIGIRLEVGYGARTAEMAAELAEHFERGQSPLKAVAYLRQAGDIALRRGAYQEAIALLSRGLTRLEALPESPERDEAEFQVQLTLGMVTTLTKGYTHPDSGYAYTRAWALGQRITVTPRLASALDGLWRYYAAKGDLPRARDLAEQCLSLSQRSDAVTFRLVAHMTLGITLFYLGEVVASLDHFEQGLALYDPAQHHEWAFLLPNDPGVACLSFMGQALWLLGYPDQALAKSQESLRLAQQLEYPFSLAYALNLLIVLHQLRREGSKAQQRAQEVIAFSKAQGFEQMVKMGTILQGWALAAQGNTEEGIAQTTQGLEASREGGVGLGLPPVLGQLAEMHLSANQPEAGLQLVEEALNASEKTGEAWLDAELYRLKGEGLLAQNSARHHVQAAEDSFLTALEIARRQGAKSWELRAAVSLSRLWRQQNRAAEARDLLAEIYKTFAEGFETADLRAAKSGLKPGDGSLN